MPYLVQRLRADDVSLERSTISTDDELPVLRFNLSAAIGKGKFRPSLLS